MFKNLFNTIKKEETTTEHVVTIEGNRDYHIVTDIVGSMLRFNDNEKFIRWGVTSLTETEGKEMYSIRFECTEKEWTQIKNLLCSFRQNEAVKMGVEMK